MYAIGTIVALITIFWSLERMQKRDGDEMEENIKHSRQDLRLIAYLLVVIAVLLGMITEKIY